MIMVVMMVDDDEDHVDDGEDYVEDVENHLVADACALLQGHVVLAGKEGGR